MKMPARYEGPLGYSDDIDFCALDLTIFNWRNGGKCLFSKLACGENVPAKKVATYARVTADTIHETSKLFTEKAKLIAVADYADRIACFESAEAAIAKAAKTAIASGMRYRDYHGAMLSAWPNAGGE